MLLPMYGLILALLVVGGLGTIVAVGDPHHARFAPYLGFICLFAGIGSLVFSLILMVVAEIALHSDTFMGASFFVGYAGGAATGGLFGYLMAERRRKT
jgi:hypothetical protein